jgi:predicted ribosomally synthesized peptide with SipW-like signal peptide
MKKIALASAAMGGVALFAFGASGTFASLTDTEQIQNLEAKASTMDLEVGTTASSPTAALKFTPGEPSQKFAYFVNNTGDVAGSLFADLVLTGNAENECTEPEVGVDGSCDPANDAWSGELASELTTRAFRPVIVDSAEDCDVTKVGTAFDQARSLRMAADASAVEIADLGNTRGLCFVYEFALPDGASNAVQSDSAKFRIDLNLKQG